MPIREFLADYLASAAGRERVVHVREEPPRPARTADPATPLSPAERAVLAARGIGRLYAHQARCLDLAEAGRDFLVATGPASGKTLCYLLPLLRHLTARPGARALLLHPTKALSRSQYLAAQALLDDAGRPDLVAGVLDGDTPPALRRRLRDRAALLFTNPDTLHAAILPQHGRFAGLLASLSAVVVDEIHALRGIFGAHAAWLFRRLFRLCRHHGSSPLLIACTGTLSNAGAHAERLFGRPLTVVDDDASPRGRRTFLLVNPPRVRDTPTRSRRGASDEAADLYAALVARGVPTIVFSKARVTAELIHRYAREALARAGAPGASRIAPYRAGLLPEERRAVEDGLFAGRLIGVSSTPALELGIDVGGLDASIVVGWPGRRASFFQQAGRAGRRGRDALAVLVGLDTPTNQFLLRHPEVLFDRPVEEAVFEEGNPLVLADALRCAAFELPLPDGEVPALHEDAPAAADGLVEAGKVRRLHGAVWHGAAEIPHHEVSLRDRTDRNFTVADADTGRLLGEVSRFDAPAVVHPGAVYLHAGETFRILDLDFAASRALARREDLAYYTQSHGYTDVHHADAVLRERPFGTGRAFFGEVTAHYRITWYERVPFHSLDPVSRHPLSLPLWPIETTAFWVVPPEAALSAMRREGLDPVSGLRGVGYAARSLLPLFATCDTLDLSHSVGSVNTPWSAVFVWEHYPRGLGFTARGYAVLGDLLTAVRRLVAECGCEDGCPLCVGKPLRPETVLNPERGEGSIPSRRAALRVLDALLGDGSGLSAPDDGALTETPASRRARIAREVRRAVERRREPLVPAPPPRPLPRFPDREPDRSLAVPDAARRGERSREIARKIRALAARKEEGP